MMNKEMNMIKTILILMLVMTTFSLSGIEKWMTGGVPDWFANDINKTFLQYMGGATLQYYGIALLECSIGVLCLISLARLEFLPGRPKMFLKFALLGSMLAFIMVLVGQRVFAQWAGNSGGFQGTANAFFYFGATLLAFYIIEKDEKEEMKNA